MNPYPYGTSCPVSMHLALFAVNLALYGFGVLVSLKLAQDFTVRGQSLPGVTNECDRELRRRTGLSVRRYPLDRQADASDKSSACLESPGYYRWAAATVFGVPMPVGSP